MDRAELLSRLPGATWDVIVIGGGASGLGAAVDAAARGLRTLLLEQSDFAKGTSSRSSKLIHGGVRYLKQGNIRLVAESLRERGLLLKNAPNLVKPLPFLVPAWSWWEAPLHDFGLKLYELLAGRRRLERTHWLWASETAALMPTLRRDRLYGGVLYFDAHFDDATLALALVRTFAALGGVPLNYLPVTGLLKRAGRICGVQARDAETGREHELSARVVINATGVFTDTLRRLDEETAPALIAASQGAHIVLDASFLPGDTAVIIPRTDDRRVLFFIPWCGKVLIGTTDTPVTQTPLEPRPLAEEIAYLLDHAGRCLAKPPGHADIRSAFAGLRPLVRPAVATRTAEVSREHLVEVSKSGLVTVAGGKWTTYRSMGEQAVDTAIASAGLGRRPPVTRTLRLKDDFEPCVTADEALVLRAVREQMARTVEDVLARRSRLLFLDARAAIEAAPAVARTMARELGWETAHEQQQVAAFTELARGYLPADARR